jgi:NAD(P)-dependent dehydrogenase (short-subunit alcohol dehydrogenase family)
MRGLAGRRVAISGGASGIGFASAARLLEEGCRVIICDRHGVDDAVSALAPAGQIRGVEAELASSASIERFFSEAEAWLGGIDGVFSNAGIFRATELEPLDLATWDEVMAVNLRVIVCVLPRRPAADGIGRQPCRNLLGQRRRR